MEFQYCSILLILVMIWQLNDAQMSFVHSMEDLEFLHELPDKDYRYSIAANTNKNNSTWCQYRDVGYEYTSEVFRLQSCFWCYRYTPPSMINPVVGLYNFTTDEMDDFYYHVVLVDGVKYDVDYRNSSLVELISRSLSSPQATAKWIECCKAAEECCDYMLDHPNKLDGCPTTWDGWYCRYETKKDSMNYGSCPDYIYSGSPPSCYHESSKRCFPNGTWNVTTDYSACSIIERIKPRIVFHIAMLSVSLAFSLPAIIIFFSYRKLRTTMRVILHRNLLIAIVIRNILAIISKSVIILDAISVIDEADSVMSQNGAGCKILAVLEKLATNSVFACMLLLGIYLHGLIAAAFRGEPNMTYFFIGAAAMSGLPVFAWTIVTATLNNRYCWTVDDGNFQWINDSFKIAMLAINMLLIFDIIRVLVTKLARVNTGNSKNIRRTTKATIFLLPVFGVQFVFTAARPNTTSCTGEQVFYFFSYGLDGIQGAVVSLLFCYLNKEVQSLLGKTFRTTKDKVRMRMDENYVPRNSTATNDPRRITFSTMVEPNHKDISAPPTPIMDARKTAEQWNDKEKPLQYQTNLEKFYSPKNSVSESLKMSNIDLTFYTPENSLAGSPPPDSNFYYSPRSSLAGSMVDVNFYDCIDDTSEVFDLPDREYSRKLTAEADLNMRNRKLSGFNIDVSKLPSNNVINDLSSENGRSMQNQMTAALPRGDSGSASDSRALPTRSIKENLDDSGYGASPGGKKCYGNDNKGFSMSTENLPDIKTLPQKRIASIGFEHSDTEV